MVQSAGEFIRYVPVQDAAFIAAAPGNDNATKASEQALDLGLDISISGVVTFKNAESLRQTVRDIVPLDRLHIETDAPFLAPVPMRGKSNTSAYVVHTAQVVADLKKVSLQTLCEQTNKNAEKLFFKLKSEEI